MNEKNIFGMLNTDGSIASWPEADLNGSAFSRTNATRAQVDGIKFVVIPVNVEFTEELKEALQGGWNGLQELRSRTVLAPVVGFTEVDDDGNPINRANLFPGIVFDPPPPPESFSKRKVISEGIVDDHS
jgi:uncharacterized protein YjbI with pentapeptide repeats